VMEYVDGEHLDTYCDGHKLGIPERLQLFLRVCDAVAMRIATSLSILT